jgi:protein-tyrosine phosphatase
MDYRFGPAAKDERIVYGAGRAGRRKDPVAPELVENWIGYMKEQGIERVCCLLDDEHLSLYDPDLLETLRQAFGEENVLHAPIPDVHVATPELLVGAILPFLEASEREEKKVVVHCSGGLGRTGHVLAAWLAYRYGISPEEALDAVVVASAAPRKPLDALSRGRDSGVDLYELLETAHREGRLRSFEEKNQE